MYITPGRTQFGSSLQQVTPNKVGRGPLGQKVAKNAFSWHSSGDHLVCGLFERHIGTLPPKKVPKRKTCQILRKRVICDYLLLNCITAKTFEILNSTITKTTCIMRKSTKNYTYKTFKQFFYFSNGFRVIRCQTPIFKLEPSFYSAILVQSSHLKQK